MRVHERGRRAVRRFLLGSGPLKRGTDRVQMLSRALVLLAGLCAVPVAALVGAATGDRLTAIAEHQAHTRHATGAVLLRNAGTPVADPASGSAGPQFTDVAARWQTPRGTIRTGRVPALTGTRAGTTVPVWVTGDGRLTTAPPDRRSVPGTAVATGVAVVGGVTLIAWAAHCLLCLCLDRRRDRQWTRGWAAVGPVWRAQVR